MTREEFFQTCIADNDKELAISDIFELMFGSFELFMNNSEIGKLVKGRLSKTEYFRFIDGLFASIFGTLYASTLDESEIEQFAQDMDGCLGFVIKEKKTDA